MLYGRSTEIDTAGICYSWPSILPVLRGQAVNYERFLPRFPGGRLLAINLRTHLKILVIDGTRAFTGWMNIRQGHTLQGAPRSPVQDLYFRVEGPVVAQLQEILADDWLFTTGEELQGREWFPPLGPAGPVFARAIPDGPDDEIDKLPWSSQGALSPARSSVKIVTPYFLSDGAMISAVNVAALRGVSVDCILPEQNNLPLVHWASRVLWWQLLQRGCRLWLPPPPFDHTKLMLVDDIWSMIGSANWDPRSMRLYSECNIDPVSLSWAGLQAGQGIPSWRMFLKKIRPEPGLTCLPMSGIRPNSRPPAWPAVPEPGSNLPAGSSGLRLQP